MLHSADFSKLKQNPLEQWAASRQSKILAMQERQCLQQLMPTRSNQQILLLGTQRFSSWLPEHSGYAVQLATERLSLTTTAYVQGDYSYLPFREENLDIVVLPYLLEYLAEPEALISEIFRVLVAQGKLFLWGFQRWHPWCWMNAPACMHPLSYLATRQLLNNHNLVVQKTRWLKYGAIYLLEAEKQVQRVTAIRADWKLPALESRLPQPSMRQAEPAGTR